MTQYKKEYDKEGLQEACNCCGYEDVEVHYFEFNDAHGNPYGFLCEICSATMIANNQYNSDGTLYRLMAWIGNHILAKLNK